MSELGLVTACVAQNRDMCCITNISLSVLYECSAQSWYHGADSLPLMVTCLLAMSLSWKPSMHSTNNTENNIINVVVPVYSGASFLASFGVQQTHEVVLVLTTMSHLANY